MNPFNLIRPKGLTKYILDRADYTYLIYDKKHVKCTSCGERWEKKYKYDHNCLYVCENCGNKAIAKSYGRGRMNITEKGRILWFTQIDGVTYAQLDEYDIDYDGSWMPTVNLNEEVQYKIGKESEMYKKQYGFYTGWYWKKMKTIKIPVLRTGYYGEYSRYCYKDILYSESLSEIGHEFKYMNVEEAKCWSPVWLIPYMVLWAKYSGFELLEKAGFENMVNDLVKGVRSRKINLKGKSLEKIFGMKKSEYNKFKLDGIAGVERYKRLKPYGIKIEQLSFFDSAATEAAYIELGEHRIKAMNYILKQRALIETETNTPRRHMHLYDYADYLRWCDVLGYTLDKRTRYPKDFWEAHDRLLNEYYAHKEELEAARLEAKAEEFRKCEFKITKMKEPYIKDGLLIRPADSQAELKDESRALSHCVRTYADRVLNGSTSILFIRKADAPDVPYFTVELDKKRNVVQCRGYKNCSYPHEVDAFIDDWYMDTYKRKRA